MMSLVAPFKLGLSQSKALGFKGKSCFGHVRYDGCRHSNLFPLHHVVRRRVCTENDGGLAGG